MLGDKRKGSTQGRKKIEMKKITNTTTRNVTFTKRRSGLFKKGSEISTICGADVAIISFSPANKVFSFGHPSVESVVNRYLGRNDLLENANDPSLPYIVAGRNKRIQQLNQQLSEVCTKLEVEKKSEEEIDNRMKAAQESEWWHGTEESLGEEQRTELLMALQTLLNNVAMEKKKIEAIPEAERSVASLGLSNCGAGCFGESMMPSGSYATGHSRGLENAGGVYGGYTLGMGVGHVGSWWSAGGRHVGSSLSSAIGHFGPSSGVGGHGSVDDGGLSMLLEPYVHKIHGASKTAVTYDQEGGSGVGTSTSSGVGQIIQSSSSFGGTGGAENFMKPSSL